MMQCLNVLTETQNDEISVLSPSVGLFSLAQEPGAYLSSNALIGKLKILNTNYHLYLPSDVCGCVIIENDRDKIIPVGYKQELCRLSTENMQSIDKTAKAYTKANHQQDTDEGFLIRASTTGIFYRKPSPEVPPYVEEGQQIEKGKVLGLIEVMKTFNHIVFQGTNKSEMGIIKKILVADAQEVKLGDGLFVIE